MKRIAIYILISLFSITGTAYAQDDFDEIKQIEDTLLVTADSMYHAFIPDDRPMYAQRFVKQLIQALKIDNSFNYDFPKLQETINIIYPEDRSFRIFNWAIAPTQVTRRYYGAIQMKSEELKLHGLIDYSGNLGKCAEDSVLTGGKWYGGLIYRLMPKQVDGETVYTLFTLNAASPISNKKLLEPMKITEDGVVFGAPIFKINSKCSPSKLINRYVIEYKKDVQASMNWDADFNAIYFDRLISQMNDPNRKYTFVPSGQYDGFKWRGNKWEMVKDLIPIENRKDGEAPTPTPIFNKEE